MTQPDQHVSPIKSPRQLVIVVALAFIVPITVIVLVSQLVTGVPHGRQESDPRILARIKAAGNVVLADASGTAGPAAGPAPAAAPAVAAVAAQTPAAATDGKKVYDAGCFACHGAGIVGAPKFGDKAAWAPRIAQGVNTLYTHAIGGFTGKGGVMPPKGGNTSLSDADVKAAVDYMVTAAK